MFCFDQIGNSIELLRDYRVTVSSGGRSLSLCICNNIGLVDSSLYDLLLIRVEVLSEVLV